jgi:hypothetical protein
MRKLLIAMGILLVLAVIGSIAGQQQADQQQPSRDACSGSQEQRDAARAMIRRSGYTCETVDGMCPYILSHGYTVYCNHYHYKFELRDHGGKWLVEAD